MEAQEEEKVPLKWLSFAFKQVHFLSSFLPVPGLATGGTHLILTLGKSICPFFPLLVLSLAFSLNSAQADIPSPALSFLSVSEYWVGPGPGPPGGPCDLASDMSVSLFLPL